MAANHIEFDDFYFRLIGIPFVGFLVPPIFFQQPIENTNFYWQTTGLAIFYTGLFWQICLVIVSKSNDRFRALGDNSKRLFWILVPCSIVIVSLCNLIHLVIEPFCNLNHHKMPTSLQINAANLVLFIAIVSMYEAIRYAALWQRTVIEKEQLTKIHLQSQLASLKSQVNPHFLFNSLNTLIHIIPDNQDNAIRFVQKLSQVYRYILEMRETTTIPVSMELGFLNAYLFLVKERFGGNFQATIHPNVALIHDLEIAPLSLQILLENAVKHNIISSKKPLHIELFVENDYLIVRNPFQPKHQVQEGMGIGLQNIKKHYALVSQKTIVIEQTTAYFTVALPLLNPIEKNKFANF
jgi:two-component system, LytTR family, sensor kinase